MGLAVKAATPPLATKPGIKKPAASERGLCKSGSDRTRFFALSKRDPVWLAPHQTVIRLR